jgi:hypothetical protein
MRAQSEGVELREDALARGCWLLILLRRLLLLRVLARELALLR